MSYATVVALQEDGGYVAFHPEFDSCLADGETVGQARENLKDVLDMTLAHHAEFELPIPTPFVLKGVAVIDLKEFTVRW